MALIEVRNLVFDYGEKRAVDHVSFEVESGTITALVGPNGAGKTSLLRCIATLEQPLSGSITLAGIDVQEAPRQAHHHLGFLQDFFGLYETLTAEQNLLFAAASLQLGSVTLQAAVTRALELVNLLELRNSKASQLSRGQRQRLAIARTIVHRPAVLLLDEPASGLDPEARRELSNMMKRLQGEGSTIIVSSHILTELADYSTHMMSMREGRFIEHTSLTGAVTEATRYTISIAGTLERATEYLGMLPDITNIRSDGSQVFFDFAGDQTAQARLLQDMITQGLAVYEFRQGNETLEQKYFEKAH